MKKLVLLSVALASCGLVMAQEVGRVISSTPIVQQVAVPTQVCGTQPMAVQAPTSGAGALVGAVAGGALGNAVGGGAGRAVATVAGVLGGAMLGNQIESSGTQVANVQQCSNQVRYENRTTGYNVVYEYAGHQYTAQLPTDPGPTIQLQISPAVTSAAPPVAAGQPVYDNGVQVATYGQPVVVAPAVYPSYYGYSYPYIYPAAIGLGVGIGLGYWGGHRGGYRGGWHGGFGHRH